MARVRGSVGLSQLRDAIAASPIVVCAPSNPRARDFADWCRHQSRDVDMVILEWLRSQAHKPAALT
jgi:hypothetical protein